MTTTPDYTKKAVAKYMNSKDRVNLLLPAGTKERIEKISGEKTIGLWIRDLVLQELEKNNN